MSKSTKSYALSRFNATKWGTAIDGPRHCPGLSRCRYQFCRSEKASPGHVGEPCWWESEYARMHEAYFREQYAHLAQSGALADLDELARRTAVLALNRLRICTRSNKAWELREDDGRLSTRVFKEFELCDRYYVAAINGEKEIMRRLMAAREEFMAELERRRAHSRALSRPVGSTCKD